MKWPIQPKFLAFYGSTLVLVLVLFRWITAYGETNLQAPPHFGGRYVSTQVPPQCPANQQLILTIEQSGIFLNGDLALQGQQTARSAAHALTLKGRWQNPELTLSGRTSAFAACSTSWSNNQVTVQGRITDGPTPELTAQLTLPDGQVWPLTAQRQAEPSRSSDH
jgi:hypothetical protein